MNDSRYPYTYACDFVREHCKEFRQELTFATPSISRSQAAQVMRAFEVVFGLTHEQMAQRLADRYLLEQDAGRSSADEPAELGRATK